MAPVDPLRESKAAEAGINARTKSPQQIIRARGEDPEEVLLDIQQWQEWLKEYEIEVPEKNSKASANSPSAIDGQKAAKILNLRGENETRR
jgi:capsid protein